MSVLSELRSQLAAVVEPLDADGLAPEVAAAAVRDFAAIERRAAAGKLLALQRVVATQAWKADGARSAAEWLSRTAGISVGHARGLLETAEALAKSGEVEGAVRAGALSESQVREVAPAAAVDPSMAAELVDAAGREAFGKLRERCARIRAASRSAEEDEAKYRRIHGNRSIRSWEDPDGTGRLDVRGHVTDIARFRALLEPHRDAAFKQARAEGRNEPGAAYSYDALVHLMDALSGSTEQPKPKRARRPETRAILIGDLAAIVRGYAVPGETVEIAGLGPVSVAEAREFLSDAVLDIVIKKGVDITTVVRTGRTIPEILQTALLANGWRCPTPSCNGMFRLQRDHVEAIALGGLTALQNLDVPCGDCHRRKTERDMEKIRAQHAGRAP